MPAALAPLPGITGRTVADWLTTRLGDALPSATAIVSAGRAYTSDGKLISSPDRLIVLTRTGGPGLAFDGVFDGVTFQARVRGAPNDDDDAETLALLVDAAFIDQAVPVVMGSHTVSRIDRPGGGPAFLVRDSAGRAHYTGNYLLFATR